MKKIIIPSVLLALFSANQAMAEYVMKYPTDEIIDISFQQNWVNQAPKYSDWVNVGSSSNCSSFVPLPETITKGQSFQQTVSGCTQSQERQVTITQKRPATGETRPVSSNKETRTLKDYSYTITNTGTKIAKECKLSAASGKFARWFDLARNANDNPNYGVIIEWDGVRIKDTASNSVTKAKLTNFTYNGYLYTRGTFDSNSQYYDTIKYITYQICREPI
jgi:hypothetical protein